MSLLYIDGFDDRTGNMVGDKGWSGIADIGVGNGRGGTNSGLSLANNEQAYLDFGGTYSTIVFGFALFLDGTWPGPTDDFMHWGERSGNNNHGVLNFTSAGGLDVYRSGTFIGSTAAAVIPAGTYAYIEVKHFVDDTTGTLDIFVNGSNIFSYSGDTRAGGGGYIDKISWRGIVSSTLYIDDLYVLNTLGSINNDRLGDVRVLTYFPDVDGGTTQWTPSTGTDHSDVVDENPPNTTDYISTSSTGFIDMFDFNVPASGYASYHGAQLFSYATKTGAGPRSFRHRVDSNASIATGSTHAPTFGSWLWFRDMFDANPDGGGAWTQATLDAAEFGVIAGG